MNKRVLGLVAAAAVAAGTGLGLALPASAHEVPPLEDPSPANVAGNLCNGTDYLLNEVQHGHLNAPLLGFGPLLADPVDYIGTHVGPVTIETVRRIGGISTVDEHPGHGGGETPPPGGHDH